MRFRISTQVLPLIMFAAVLPLMASAQFAPSEDALTLSSAPQYPAPNSSVTVTPLSAVVNLANATMIVAVNGTEISRGPAQPFSVKLGRAGKSSVVRVTVLSNGQSYSQSLTLVPQDVLLIAEPIASAPPLYPGKALAPLEGQVRMVAFANLRNENGTAASPATLSYAWSVDGVQQAAASGIGRSALIVASPLQYRNRTVSVVVQAQDGSLVGGASYSFVAQDPIVRLYERDPLLGIRFERALSDTYTLKGTESSLYGAAYSFPTSRVSPALEWYVNGERVQTGPTVTLRSAGAGTGSATVSVIASLGDVIRATEQLAVSFGTAPRTNFFGL